MTGPLPHSSRQEAAELRSSLASTDPADVPEAFVQLLVSGFEQFPDHDAWWEPLARASRTPESVTAIVSLPTDRALRNVWTSFEAGLTGKELPHRRDDTSLETRAYRHGLAAGAQWPILLAQLSDRSARTPADRMLLARALENTERYDEAAGVYESLVDSKFQRAAQVGALRSLRQASDWQRLRDHALRTLRTNADSVPARRDLADATLLSCGPADGLAYVERVVRPESTPAVADYVEACVRATLGDFPRASQLLEQSRSTLSFTQAEVLLLAESARQGGQLDLATKRFSELDSEWLRQVGMARIAEAKLHFTMAVDHWRCAFEASRSPQTGAGLIRALFGASRPDEASALLSELVETGVIETDLQQTLLAHGHIIRYEFGPASALLQGVLDSGNVAEVRSIAINLCSDIALRQQSDQSVLIDQLRRLNDLPPAGPTLAAKARVQVALGLDQEALRTVEDIVRARYAGPDALELRAWAATRRGDHHEASELGQCWNQRTYIPALHAPEPNLTVRKRGASSAGNLIAIAVVRNEESTIEAVLDHHRRLGVAEFHVVDNGSTDTTVDLLMQHGDTTVYSTTDDYVEAGSGMRWVNEIAERQAADWVLFIDADELLVYPHSESVPLPSFIEWLEAEGSTAVAGFMLDLYADDADRDVSISSYDDASFVNSYSFQPSTRSPYTDVRGGFADDGLGLRYRELTKTPLIRFSKGVRFLTSSHVTTPSKVSTARCVLLHFKYLGDLDARLQDEAAWTPSPYYSSRADQLSSARPLSVPAASVRYAGSGQLLQMGLLGSCWLHSNPAACDSNS